MNQNKTIRLILFGLGAVAVQTMLLRHFKFFGAEVDLVLIYLVWLCTQRSRTETLLFAGLLGFLQDAIVDLWGLHLFSKTLMVFILHGYLNRISKKRFIFWQVVLIILLAALVHNIFFYLMTLFSEIYSPGTNLWTILIGNSIFTAAAGGFLHLVREEK